MGRRGATETLAQVMLRLLEKRRFVQSELARDVGITVEGLRKVLGDLREAGVPLRAERDGAFVVWTVDAGWFPGAVAFAKDDAVALLRMLLRVPAGAQRDAFVARLLAMPEGKSLSAVRSVVATPQMAEDEARYLERLEEAGARRTVVSIKYSSTTADSMPRWRSVSVQRVFPPPRSYVLAWDHDRGELRWFNLHRVGGVQDRGDLRFVARPDDELRAKVDDSAGFFAGGEREALVFCVRDDAWRWARDHLPAKPTKCEPAGDGWTRVTVQTAGRRVLARFLVGLGDAARAESEGLRDEVRSTAEGALRANVSEPSAGASVRATEKKPRVPAKRTTRKRANG
jgi:predicted DNA-binding transcriptional regulator YafY